MRAVAEFVENNYRPRLDFFAQGVEDKLGRRVEVGVHVEVEQLRSSCERFDALSPEQDLRGLVRENLLFHNTILDVAGSARLAGMVRKVIELPLVYKSYIWYSPDQKRISVHYHRQIVNALAARDAERAELIMKEHVFEARDLLVSRVRANPFPPTIEERG